MAHRSLFSVVGLALLLTLAHRAYAQSADFDRTLRSWQTAPIGSRDEARHAQELQDIVRRLLGESRIDAYRGYLEAEYGSEKEGEYLSGALSGHERFRPERIEEMLGTYFYARAWNNLEETAPEQIAVQIPQLEQDPRIQQARSNRRNAAVGESSADTEEFDSLLARWQVAEFGSPEESEAAESLREIIERIMSGSALQAYRDYLEAPVESPLEAQAYGRFLEALGGLEISLSRAEVLAGMYAMVGGFEHIGPVPTRIPQTQRRLNPRGRSFAPDVTVRLASFVPVFSGAIRMRTGAVPPAQLSASPQGVQLVLPVADTLTIRGTVTLRGALHNDSGEKIEVPVDQNAAWIPLDLHLWDRERSFPATFETTKQPRSCSFDRRRDCYGLINRDSLVMIWQIPLIGADRFLGRYFSALRLLDRSAAFWPAEAAYWSAGSFRSKEMQLTRDGTLLVMRAGWSHVALPGALGALIALLVQLSRGGKNREKKPNEGNRERIRRILGWVPTVFAAVVLAVVILSLAMLDPNVRIIPLATDRPLAALVAGMLIQIGGWGVYGPMIGRLTPRP